MIANQRIRRIVVLVVSIYTLLVWDRPLIVPLAQAAGVSCTSTSQCETQLRNGSQCVNGFCSNPYGSGCLLNQKPGWTRKRVCNSDDPPDSGVKGICRPPRDDFNYMEIRIAVQNWESVYFEAYILQIILSEILDVPTTLETGSRDVVVNLYDPTNRFEYGKSNLWGAIRESAIQGDCRKLDRSKNISCAHVIPEVWAGHEKTITNYTHSGYIEPPSFIGVVGQEGLYIPQFTADRDYSLVSYHGLAGPQNRRKLAERFLRPTTWGDYCTDVSVSKCQKSDNVTSRAPVDDKERRQYFVDGLYTGYFRKTEENDCDQWPSNCTGHVADYPCGWHSYIVPQSYWLDIGLKSSGKEPSGGYTYNQLSQIWQAANATQSDIITMWWNPESVYQTFLKTASQMEYVTMPAPDPQCILAHIDPIVRCNGTMEDKRGKSKGVCSDPPLSLLKVMSSSLRSETNNPTIVAPLRSPGYEAIKNFRINNIELSEIFDYWLHSKYDRYSFGPREATCRWVVENFKTIEGLVPNTYPRVIVERKQLGGKLSVAALIIACVTIGCAIISAVLTYQQRKRPVMKYAQVEFMFLLLFGVLLVSVSALLQVLQVSDPRCVAIIWLYNVGFSLEVVPLIVKVAAINRLMQAAQKMRRVQLTRKTLFRAVALLCGMFAVILMFWTIFDPPRKTPDYQLTQESSSENQTIISSSYFCQSASPAWIYVTVMAEFFMLVCTSVVAFQTRKLRHDLNETQTLAILTYSHFMFMAMRITIIGVQSTISVTTASDIFSLIYSLDSIATVVIYFVPKFLWNQLSDNEERREWMMRYFAIPVVTRSQDSVDDQKSKGKDDSNDASFIDPSEREGRFTADIRTATDTSVSHAGMRMESDESPSQFHWPTEIDSDHVGVRKPNLGVILEVDSCEELPISDDTMDDLEQESAPRRPLSSTGESLKFQEQKTNSGTFMMEQCRSVPNSIQETMSVEETAKSSPPIALEQDPSTKSKTVHPADAIKHMDDPLQLNNGTIRPTETMQPGEETVQLYSGKHTSKVQVVDSVSVNIPNDSVVLAKSPEPKPNVSKPSSALITATSNLTPDPDPIDEDYYFFI